MAGNISFLIVIAIIGDLLVFWHMKSVVMFTTVMFTEPLHARSKEDKERDVSQHESKPAQLVEHNALTKWLQCNEKPILLSTGQKCASCVCRGFIDFITARADKRLECGIIYDRTFRK